MNLGIPLWGLEKKIRESVEKCFLAVELRVIFYILSTSSCNRKGYVPALLRSNVVYNFLCHCDSRYVGRTFRRLQDRLCQYVPKFIRTAQIPNSRDISTRSGKSSISVMFCESAIGQHLLDNPMCAKNYSDENFTILSFGRLFFHLSALEAVHIKLWKPNLCRQKDFVYKLKLLR